MKKIKLFIPFIYLIVGVLIGLFISNYVNNKKIEYFELQGNYVDDNLGVIKKGTLLKYDQSFSEGFTRYVLYLNIQDSEAPKFKKISEKDKLIIPYWVEKEE